MTSRNLEGVAQTLVAEGRGILAADETVPTSTKRFDALGIRSTEPSRRSYREMLDMPEITCWRWGQEAASAAIRSTEADNV
jgi:fructose-bisphosphate aldolase class 1